MEKKELLNNGENIAEARKYTHNAAFYDIGVIYYDEDDKLRNAIASVLTALPEEVKEFVLEHCFILSTGEYTYGTVWPGKIFKNISWVIVLNEKMPKSKGDRESIIAHEIAHAYLGHDQLNPDIEPECEIEACNLTKQWGFNGLGTNIKRCYRELNPIKSKLKPKI